MMGGVPTLGLADEEPRLVGAQVLAAWDCFLDLAAATPLEAPSRLPGWRAHDVLVHLGAWEGRAPLAAVLESARSGAVHGLPDADADNALVVATHRTATRADVLQALRRARDSLAEFFAGPDARQLGRTEARSALGPLPVLTLAHASTYELAVHALDLVPSGAPAPDPLLLDRGLAALMDVTGALAARSGIHLTVSATTPDGGWAFTAAEDGWTVQRPLPSPDGPGVHGTAADLLDASAGRQALPLLLARRRLSVSHLPQFLRLAPLVQEVPGLPGGAALRTGVQGVSALGSVGGAARDAVGGLLRGVRRR